MNLQAAVNSLIGLFPTFESRIYLIVTILFVTVLANILARIEWYTIFRHLMLLHAGKQAFVQERKTQKQEKWFLWGLTIVGFFASVYVLWITLTQRPNLLSTSPQQYSVLTTTDTPISIEFDIPVDVKNMTFYTSPEVEGDWRWDYSVLGTMSRKVEFIPQQSFYPGSRITVYMVGLRPVWGAKEQHEMALQFDTPDIPTITNIEPNDGAEDVSTQSQLRFTFDHALGRYVDISYQISPDPGEYSVNREDKFEIISFEDPLKQDTEYKVDVVATPRSYVVETDEDIERGYSQNIKLFTFTTVSTPLLSSFSPKGDSVLITSPIQVAFDQKMQRSSVEKSFSITPKVLGDTSWNNDGEFVFAPKEELAKETEYTVSFAGGMQSVAGGIVGEPVSFAFTTIGKVAPSRTVPATATYGVDPTNSNVEIEFNQEVDHDSAVSKVSLSPIINYATAWDGNTLVLQTAGKLGYSTRYSLTISPGIKTVNGLDSTETFTSYFVTRDNVFTLAVPYYNQQETFTCNVAAARMALAYRGVSVGEGDIKSSIGIGQDPNTSWVNGYGTHVDTIASYVGRYRTVVVKHNWTVKELVAEVKKGNPVIIWEYNRYSQPYGSFTLQGGYTGYKGMHSEVVRGFIGPVDNPTHILTNDPWRGQLTYTRSLFESVWSYLGNTALVVY